MKTKWMILTITVFFLLTGYCLAHEGMKHDEGMESMDHAQDAIMEHDDSIMNNPGKVEIEMHIATEEDAKALPNIGNKICPVSGNKVDDGKMGEAVLFVYNGKIYNLCCSMCVKDFKKDPEKYSKVAEDEVAKEKEGK